MFVGHLAVALAVKRVEPRIPLGASVAAAFGLDLIWPVLLLLGLEAVRVNPGDTAFTNLAFDSYPWSHSLLAAFIWSAAAALAGKRLLGAWRASVLLGALVLSHWVLDFLTHRPDLPVWPDGPRVGLGLWYSIPGTILLEGALFGVGLWLYVGAGAARDRIGRWALVALAVFTGLIWVSQPWAPLPESPTAVAVGALVLWLLVPWSIWIDQHRGRPA